MKEKQRQVENKPSGGNNNNDNKNPQNRNINHPKIPNSQGNKLVTDKKKSNIHISGDSKVKRIEG